MTKEISLDLNLTDEQLECVELHCLFKSKWVYDDLKKPPFKDTFDQVRVFYSADYNDCYYDIRPLRFDLIKDGNVINTIEAESNEFEHHKCINSGYEQEYSFIITKNMI